jgi:shikimate kinase
VPTTLENVALAVFVMITGMVVAVIGGPIASGKSSLSRATATRLEETGKTKAAVIDLDVIYEMLDPRGRSGRPKSDERLWSQARRTAGRLAAFFLHEGRCVVAEGNFAADQALREFEAELPADVPLRLVLLNIDFEIALQRTQADPSRGLSKDRSFLSIHHGEFDRQWRGRDVLELDTGSFSVAEAADAVASWLKLTG